MSLCQHLRCICATLHPDKQFEYKTQMTINMKFTMASLFFAFLLQIIACGQTADQQESSTMEPAAETTNSVSPVPEQTAAPQMEEEISTEHPVPARTAESPTPKAVKTAQKKIINTPPEKPKAEASAPKEPEVIEAAPEPMIKEPATAVTAPQVKNEPEPIVPENTQTEEPKPKLEAKPDHTQWNTLLQKHVSATGKVNYAGFKADKTKLQTYLDALAANPVQDNWSRAEKMAYWINVYNAFTIKLIVDNYPVSSITKLHNGKPWDVKWIKLGDKTYSLNEVENDILRPKYQDARIHFAVNCAAKSCPPLLNRAWTGENLNSYLEKQTAAFINNAKYNTISTRKVEVSKIFEWYASDFSNLIEFLNKYSKTSINKGASVSYKEYDWGLNN